MEIGYGSCRGIQVTVIAAQSQSRHAAEAFQRESMTRRERGSGLIHWCLVQCQSSNIVRPFKLLGLLLGCLLQTGCGTVEQEKTTITLWHQMVVAEREVLADKIAQFESLHPTIQVKALYKETEELRSGFQAAVLAGTGPELIYGPSDSLGAFDSMGIVGDMSDWFSQEELDEFIEQSLTWIEQPPDTAQLASSANAGRLVQVGDRVGNHLTLVYNRKLIPEPPGSTDQLVELAVGASRANSSDRAKQQYGLVWNFVEPFFLVPFLSGYGGWVFEENSSTPSLDTPEVVEALRFVASLQQQHRVLPANCDYETADMLFKSGRAAMIINGDWSWSDYLSNPSIDAAIAPLPVVSETGLPMAPMVATKGYSLNVNAQGGHVEAAKLFTRFMTSMPVQREFMQRLKTLPSLKKLMSDPYLQSDPTLAASARQVQQSRPMPIIAEMRAVWDAMRPPYQSLLAGELTAQQAASKMQSESVRSIRLMNQQLQPDRSVLVIQSIGVLLLGFFLFRQRSVISQLRSDWSRHRLAYLFVAPAILVTLLTIVYPFIYNIVLSFSNMSLRNFRDWQMVGLQNYLQVLYEPRFLWIFFKTILWTVLNLLFHLSIGLLLAVMLNGPVRGKSIYRVLLILPWAIPAYITALSWRGMFDAEYGAINSILTQWFGLEKINWLGEELNAFFACLITNIWLGFPFIMVIALGGMQGIPIEMYEAARMEGVSRWQQFWHITLPMLRPVLMPAVTLGAIWTFNNLNVVWLVSNGGEPADKTHILVSYVYKSVFNLYQYGSGAALSMIIFGMLLVFSLTFLRRTQATESVT